VKNQLAGSQTSIGNFSCDLEEEVIPRVPPRRPRARARAIAIGRHCEAMRCDAIVVGVNQEDKWSKESCDEKGCMHCRDSSDARL
jgi:hypothetical protein